MRICQGPIFYLFVHYSSHEGDTVVLLTLVHVRMK